MSELLLARAVTAGRYWLTIPGKQSHCYSRATAQGGASELGLTYGNRIDNVLPALNIQLKLR